MKINLSFKNPAKFDYDKKLIKQLTEFIIKTPEVYEKSCLKNKAVDELAIGIVFCDDEFIHKVNKEYRGMDRPTDVISFALYSDDPNSPDLEEIELGEIIVSIDTAKKQAVEGKHSLEKEVYYLIAHGILHLLGFDHQAQEEYNFMVSVQNEVLKKINV